MPYLYSDEQKQIREEVSRVLAGTTDPATLRILLESDGRYDERYWQTARDMGWTAMGVAEEDGGLGLSLVETMIVAEETGGVLAGAPFLATGFSAAHGLKLGGQNDVLRALATGDNIAALAFGEGGDPLPLRSAVTVSTDETITGEKTAVLGGAVADVALVLCRNAEGAPEIALVDLNGAGVTRTIVDTIDNSRCIATLSFDQAAATIMPLNDAALVARQCLGRLALHLASEAVGGIGACLRLAADYANQRQAFGQAIGKFQAVKHAISEIYVANELARASVLDAAVRLENGDDAEAYVAAARLNAIHGYDYAAAASTQIHGGIGVTWEAELHLHYRRARTLALEAGGATYWEDRIVNHLESA